MDAGCVLRAIRAGIARIKWADDRRAVCVDATAEEVVARLLAAQTGLTLERLG